MLSHRSLESPGEPEAAGVVLHAPVVSVVSRLALGRLRREHRPHEVLVASCDRPSCVGGVKVVEDAVVVAGLLLPGVGQAGGGGKGHAA